MTESSSHLPDAGLTQKELETHRRVNVFFTLCKLALPVVLGLMLLETAHGRFHMVGALGTALGVLGICYLMVDRTGFNRWWLRIPLAVFTMLAIFYVLQDYTPGSLLFLILFPFFNPLLLGIREGMIWNGLLGASSGVIMLPAFPFPVESLSDMGVDYFVAFVLASGCAFAYHRNKHLMQKNHSARIAALECRLSEVEARGDLGLVSICSGCKKVQEDTGEWTGIDRFLASLSEVSFSHGFCPDCANDFLLAYKND